MTRKQTSKKQELCWEDIPDANLDEEKLEAARSSGELLEWDDDEYWKLLSNSEAVAKAFFSSLEEREPEQAASIISHYLANKKRLAK